MLLLVSLAIGLIACENQKNEFADFDYTTGYFPYQYPVRTLVLGDYIFPNENDNNHKFLISVGMGGVYENSKNREFDFEVDNSLCNKALFLSSLDTIRAMPASYYSLSSLEKIVIPKGKFNGSVEVQLTDAFFNDPRAIKNSYVIPLRLIGSTDVDSILIGDKVKDNPDRRIPADWNILPKDFTLFCVKYINPYHGKYLHRGISKVTNASAVEIESTAYRTKYIVDNEIWSLTTTAKKQVTVSGSMRSIEIPGILKMNLTFDDNENCTITEAVGSTFVITGSGKFINDADEWGNKKRDAIHINYQLTSAGNTYSATDTLVIRDRAVIMELFTPKIF